MTSKLYMTNKKLTPKKSNFSVTGERINTIVERDIALTALIMVIGLLFRNESGLRGFPVGWLYTGSDPSLQSRPDFFCIAIGISAAIAVICELAVYVIGRTTESPYTNGSGSQYSADAGEVYANTYDDSNVTDKSHDKNPQIDIKIPDLPLRRKENPVFKELNIKPRAASSGGISGSSAYRKSGSASSNAVLRLVLIVFALITIFVIGITVSIFTATHSPDFEYYDDDSTYDFYVESGFMEEKCEEAFEILSSGNAEALAELGGGSPKKLLSMADWSDVSYNEDNRSLTTGETDSGIIRYYVEANDGREYMVAFKFEGGNLAYDESTAVLIGIAACPYDVWSDHDPDYEWDEFSEQFNAQMAYVGDVEYMDENILIW